MSGRTLSIWNLLLLIGGMLLLFAAATRIADVSGTGCGRLILGRYSAPAFVVLGVLTLSGILSIAGAFTLSAAQIRSWVGRLSLAGFGLLIGLVAVELYLRLLNPLPSVDDLKVVNHDVLGFTYQANTVVVTTPREGHEFSTELVTDERGLVIRDDNPNRPHPDAHRIMLIGDSFAAGMQVPALANMSEILERQLADATGEVYQVINVGMGNYDPVTYLLAYRAHKEYFDPETVIVVFYVGNDFTTPIRRYLSDRVISDEDGRPIAMRPNLNMKNLTAWQQDTLRYEPIRVRENQLRQGLAIASVLKSGVMYPLCSALEEQKNRHLASTAQATVATGESATAVSPATGGGSSDLPAWWSKCGDTSGKLTSSCHNYRLRNDSLIRNNYAAIYKDVYTPLDLEDIGYTLRVLGLLADEVRADGRVLVLVIMPEKAQVPNQPGYVYIDWLEPGMDHVESSKPQEVLLEFCEANSLPYVDLLPAMRAHSDQKLFWEHDSHITEAGHKLAADEILRLLLEMGEE